MTRVGDIQRNKTLAKKYRVSVIYGLYFVKTGLNDHVANIAEMVARKVGRDGDLDYEREIRAAIQGIESSNEYRNLLNGDATPGLVLNTLTWYRHVRGCR